MSDFLFRGELAAIDPDLKNLIEIESERQYKKLILVPSESTSPKSVREALDSSFHNIYAEGYPPEFTRSWDESEIFDYSQWLSHYRRFSDPRYYKGVEYADTVEALARYRCARVFAANGLSANQIFVNVQALSGGPANNAVYHGLVNPGDTVMGMNLLHGGHLSHGSPVNRSGKLYNIVSYSVDSQTELLDYEKVRHLAIQSKPKMIIAGISSYPWILEWQTFRDIADEVGALLLADMSHVAGLIAAKEYPSPVGIADVVSSTTHKTLCGPRGAIILTADPKLARKIDRAVFPGEQGGPHVNVFAAMAVAFKLATTDQFARLQSQIVKNCAIFSNRLEERGLRIAFGGTNTHLLNIDTSTIRGKNGAWLTGDMAARLLDIAGIVVNRNTIPGDKSARNPSGIRMGTPWITQRGFMEKETTAVADLVADLLLETRPYIQGKKLRAKIDFDLLESIKIKVRNLAVAGGIDFQPTSHGYPHFYYSDDKPEDSELVLELTGEKVCQYLSYLVEPNIEDLEAGRWMRTTLDVNGTIFDCSLAAVSDRKFLIAVDNGDYGIISAWLRALSDGYISFDEDILKKMPGPIVVKHAENQSLPKPTLGKKKYEKPYTIGISSGEGTPLPEFTWNHDNSSPDAELKKTPIHSAHVDLGAKLVPFAGWEMPVRYASVMEEHLSVRQNAGLFDVAHMGVYQAEGNHAVMFLDSVCSNDISSLNIGESLYTHFLSPHAEVIDDLLVYRRGRDKYLIVVNSSNDDKNWEWLNAVRQGTVLIDHQRPWAKAFGRNLRLRNLRDKAAENEMLVDLALQGPRSLDILLALDVEQQNHTKLSSLKRTQLIETTLGGYKLVVSRTGYTGENIAFELFVHPDKAKALFLTLLEIGEPYGLKPIGLAARDSLRTEAGLPLYGHEMGDEFGLGVAEAGFGSYVKTYKPWFIGRESYLEKEIHRDGLVARFRFNEKAVRMAHPGDPVMDKRGKVIGFVTSCAGDSEGYLLGQAYVDLKNTSAGTKIFIYQGSSNRLGKAPSDLKRGDRTQIPSQATILSRFPKKA